MHLSDLVPKQDLPPGGRFNSDRFNKYVLNSSDSQGEIFFFSYGFLSDRLQEYIMLRVQA